MARPFGVFGGPTKSGEPGLTQRFDASVSKNADKGHARLKKGIDNLKNGKTQNSPLDYKFQKAIFFVKPAVPAQLERDGEGFVFQFNPETIKDSRTTKYATTHPIQSEQALYQHISFGERVLSFKIMLNGLEPFLGRSLSTKTDTGLPFAGNKFGALTRPIKMAKDGAISFAARKIPFAEGIGTALGQVNRFFGKEFTSREPSQMRNLYDAQAQLEQFMHGNGNEPPPELQFYYSNYKTSRWIMTTLNYDINMWNMDQEPILMTASVTLKEVARRVIDKQVNKAGGAK